MPAKTILYLLICLLCSIKSYSQDSHTIVTIDNKPFSVEEFDFIYNKNNNLSEEPKSKKEYIDLFVNYKLKVREAEEQGLDTLPSFLKEFNYYKEELAKPYLTDNEVTEKLKKEAYDRLKTEVKASHILVTVKKDASPEDTLKAYQKVEDIKNKIAAGADFNQMAFEFSEDPSAKKNKGELGYFSGFMMVYPFESAAFNTEVGDVSDITRTQFGYHIIKVEDKRPNRGEIRTAHIMKVIPPRSTEQQIQNIKSSIDSIYQLLQSGADFEDLARKYSDDKNTARNGGELPWFGTSRMIPEFSEPAFQLDSVGQISTVIKTPYGFHIIKLLEKRGVKPYEEMEDEISRNISRDERSRKGRDAVLERIKKEDHYTENKSTMDKIVETANVNNQSKEKFIASLSANQDEIFSLKGESYKMPLFINDAKQNKEFRTPVSKSKIDKLIHEWIEEKLIEQEKADLSDKYPEYKFLLQEYYDGLLIFEISKREIWDKASQDSTGIKNFYENHKENYFFPEQLIGKAIFASDKKTMQKVNQFIHNDATISNDSLYILCNKKNIKIIDGPIAKGEYKLVDKTFWKEKDTKGLVFDNYPFVVIQGEEKPKQQKEFDQTKGQVIADYQEELENIWINDLKTKYTVVINTKALKYAKKD